MAMTKTERALLLYVAEEFKLESRNSRIHNAVLALINAIDAEDQAANKIPETSTPITATTKDNTLRQCKNCTWWHCPKSSKDITADDYECRGAPPSQSSNEPQRVFPRTYRHDWCACFEVTQTRAVV